MVDEDVFDELVQRVREVFFALRGISEELLTGLDCTVAERGILQDLERLGPHAVPAMAQARAVSRQAMQKTVDRLIARKCVSCEPNPRHLRSPLIALTPAGLRLLKEIRNRERRLLSRAKLPVTPAALRSATGTLRTVGTCLSSLEVDPGSLGSGGARR